MEAGGGGGVEGGGRSRGAGCMCWGVGLEGGGWGYTIHPAFFSLNRNSSDSLNHRRVVLQLETGPTDLGENDLTSRCQ